MIVDHGCVQKEKPARAKVRGQRCGAWGSVEGWRGGHNEAGLQEQVTQPVSPCSGSGEPWKGSRLPLASPCPTQTGTS